MSTTTTPDYTTIKSAQNAAWTAGDYSIVGTTLQIVGEQLCEALDLRAGQQVLDVAAGNGNVSLAAARRFANVVSTDYVADLLENGKVRAAAERLPMEFITADAEDLPFDDRSFDVVTSSFGVMFTPNQEQAAAELLRVTRSGGKIGLANWTPTSFVGRLFKTLGSFVPPPAGLQSPALWGTQDRLNTFFGAGSSMIDVTSRNYVWRYRSAQHWLTTWWEVYGPLQKAFGKLDEAGQQQLTGALLELLEDCNVATDGTLVIPSEYLEVVVTKR